MMHVEDLTPKQKEVLKIRSFAVNPDRPESLLFRSDEFTRDEYPEVYTDMMAVSRTSQAYTRTALLFVGFAIALSDFVLDKVYFDMRAHFFCMLFAILGFIMFFYGWIRNTGMQMAVLRNKMPMDLFGPWMMFIFGNIICIIALSLVLAK
jgi:uncharacterized membrane protein YidH (DUF202 family)